MSSVIELCTRARAVKDTVGSLGTLEKNRALNAIADALIAHKEDIKAAKQAKKAAKEAAK